jgi:uncharacterized protein (TIGR04551 family)
MASHWGLGMVANGGECDGCDGGDSADRIAFVSPLAGHVWAVSYDFSSSGPTTPRRDAARSIDIEPSDDVRTFTIATMRWHSDEALKRRRAAGRQSIEYGAYLSHRRQDNDVPAYYLPVAQPPAIDASQVIARGFRATAADLWLRYTSPLVRLELEAVYSTADIAEPSLVPGVELDQPVTSRQFGVAFESELDLPAIDLGLDSGFASGDDAPGVGAFAAADASATMPGDLDGPQANLPSDTTVDNFRFHPDYRIDQILFREIIGTVTDAIYLRPNVSYQLFDVGHATLTARFAAIASWAVEANSTPSGNRFLGVELDPTLRFESRDGFVGSLEYGLFLPGSAFDNAIATFAAEPAQLLRLRLEYLF